MASAGRVNLPRHEAEGKWHMTDTLAPGLYLVPTPLGNARDITLRGLDVLTSATVLVAEDTRSLRRLLDLHGVAIGGRPCFSYHEHSHAGDIDKILRLIGEGQSVAYASEAGTPLISDPGFELVRAAQAADVPVIGLPGPSAVVTALSIAGLPTDRFCFLGFLPQSAGARRKVLQEVAEIPATLVFYESPHRVEKSLRDMADVLGGDRSAALCRELTKKFEETRRGTLTDLADGLAERPAKGEIVLLVERAAQQPTSAEDLDAALQEALTRLPIKQAAAELSDRLNLPKRTIYQRGLELLGKS